MKNYPWMTSDQSVTFDRFLTSDRHGAPAAASVTSAKQRGTGLSVCRRSSVARSTDRAVSGLLAWSLPANSSSWPVPQAADPNLRIRGLFV